jgi:hypothetical protein
MAANPGLPSAHCAAQRPPLTAGSRRISTPEYPRLKKFSNFSPATYAKSSANRVDPSENLTDFFKFLKIRIEAPPRKKNFSPKILAIPLSPDAKNPDFH